MRRASTRLRACLAACRALVCIACHPEVEAAILKELHAAGALAVRWLTLKALSRRAALLALPACLPACLHACMPARVPARGCRNRACWHGLAPCCAGIMQGGVRNPGRQLQFEELGSHAYLEAALLESLRFFTTAPNGTIR